MARAFSFGPGRTRQGTSEVESKDGEVKDKGWQHFHTFKQRGEWVELEFMAQAALHGFSVSKPLTLTLPTVTV